MTSWNLDRMDIEKSENLGIKEVICRTILENRLSILCLQEILQPEALKNLCNELNEPTLKRVQEWRENSRNWKFFTNSTCQDGWLNGLGFIYDADFCQWIDVESTEIYLDDCSSSSSGDSSNNSISNIGNSNNEVPPTGYLAAFKLSDWTCYVLNIYLRYFNLLNTNCVLKCVETQLESRIRNSQLKFPTINDVFLVAGDFSGAKYQYGEYYKRIVKPQKCENIISSSSSSNNKNLNDDDDNNDGTYCQTTVDIDLKNLGFYNTIEHGITKVTNDDDITKISSCNILCREKLQNETIYLNNKNLKVPLRKNFNDKLTGHSGIIRKGLHHMAIPKGWNWGGPASMHCPLWIEIYRRSNRDVPAFLQTTPMRSHLNSTSSCYNRKINNETLKDDKNIIIMNGISNGNDGIVVSSDIKNSNVNGGYAMTISNGNLNISSDSVFLSDSSKKI